MGSMTSTCGACSAPLDEDDRRGDGLCNECGHWRADRSGMTRLAPGVYDDGEGGLHLDVGELLTANDLADTPENRAAIEAAARDMLGEQGIDVEVRP